MAEVGQEMKKLEWRTHKPNMGPPVEQAYVGKIKVGYYRWSLSQSKSDPEKYDFCCLLPGFIKSSGFVSTSEEAKDRIEKMVASWFSAVSDDVDKKDIANGV